LDLVNRGFWRGRWWVQRLRRG